MTARSEKRVIPLELFFDLVFVFALTQVTALMSDDPTWRGLGRGMLVLAALWWAWGAYSNGFHKGGFMDEARSASDPGTVGQRPPQVNPASSMARTSRRS